MAPNKTFNVLRITTLLLAAGELIAFYCLKGRIDIWDVAIAACLAVPPWLVKYPAGTRSRNFQIVSAWIAILLLIVSDVWFVYIAHQFNFSLQENWVLVLLCCTAQVVAIVFILRAVMRRKRG
jgi:hypothetical protein